MIPAQLATALDARRTRLGMSKVALARRADVSLATVNRILTGRERHPAIDTVAALARALGLEVCIGANDGVREVVPAAAFREAQAREKANRLVRIVQGSMALEAEAVEPDDVRRLEQEAVHALLAGPNRRLWGEDG